MNDPTILSKSIECDISFLIVTVSRVFFRRCISQVIFNYFELREQH